MGSKNRKKYVHSRKYKTRRKYEYVVSEEREINKGLSKEWKKWKKF